MKDTKPRPGMHDNKHANPVTYHKEMIGSLFGQSVSAKSQKKSQLTRREKQC